MQGGIPEDTPNWWRQILRGKLRSRGRIVDGTHQGRVRRVLDSQEVGVLIRFLPNFSQLIDDLLTLYLWTGARGAEIVKMEACEVGQEADGWWWTVPREKLKTGHHDLAVDFRVPLVGCASDSGAAPPGLVQERVSLPINWCWCCSAPRRAKGGRCSCVGDAARREQAQAGCCQGAGYVTVGAARFAPHR